MVWDKSNFTQFWRGYKGERVLKPVVLLLLLLLLFDAVAFAFVFVCVGGGGGGDDVVAVHGVLNPLVLVVVVIVG